MAGQWAIPRNIARHVWRQTGRSTASKSGLKAASCRSRTSWNVTGSSASASCTAPKGVHRAAWQRCRCWRAIMFWYEIVPPVDAMEALSRRVEQQPIETLRRIEDLVLPEVQAIVQERLATEPPPPT